MAEEIIVLPEKNELPGCVLTFNIRTLEIVVKYPDGREYTIFIGGLLKQLPKVS